MELGATDLNGTDLNGQSVLFKIQSVLVTASTAVRQGRAFALLRTAAAQAAPSLHRAMALGKSIVATPSAHAWRQIRPAALAVQSAAVTTLRRRVGLVASVAQSCAVSVLHPKFLLRQIGIGVASAVSMRRHFTRYTAMTATALAISHRAVARFIAVTSAAQARMLRVLQRVQALTASIALSLGRSKTFKVHLAAAATAAAILSRSFMLRRTATSTSGVSAIRRIGLYRLVSAVAVSRKTMTRFRAFMVAAQAAVIRMGRFAMLADLGASVTSLARSIARTSLARSIARLTRK